MGSRKDGSAFMRIEQEANMFAVCLLIPREMILKDLKKGLDLGSDDDMKTLCKKYGVTMTTMVYRLSLLKPWKK